jgi:hypothetical protein
VTVPSGRRTKAVTIAAEGRDRGKTFLLTEMDAWRAEDWFDRAMMMLARSGTDVPPDIFRHGPAGFAVMGLGAVVSGLSKAPWADVRALLDEMFGCVAFVPPLANAEPIRARELVDGQIEEVATRLLLREEVVSLHLGFSLRERLSRYRGIVATAMGPLTPTTSTSPGGAAPSSAAASPPSSN